MTHYLVHIHVLDMQINSSGDQFRRGRLSSATMKSLQRKKKETNSSTIKKSSTLTSVTAKYPLVAVPPHRHPSAIVTRKETATTRAKPHTQQPHGTQKQGAPTASQPTKPKQSQEGGKGVSQGSIKSTSATPKTTSTAPSTKATRIPLPSSSSYSSSVKRRGQARQAGSKLMTYTKNKRK